MLGLTHTALGQEVSQSRPHQLGHALLYLVVFAIVGVLTMIGGFKLFDKAITRINLEQEILKGNTAAGILAGAVIIGLSIIIAASMM